VQPTSQAERYRVLDVLRGFALLGVLLMNLMGSFRLSLFDYMAGRRNDGGLIGRQINDLVEFLVEFKAFTLFSFLFGVGAAIQAERLQSRGGGDVRPFLARRFAILFLIGAAHVVFLWNGDILTLYAVCGLCVVVPLIRASPMVTALAGTAFILQSHLLPLPVAFPSHDAMSAQAALATRVYATGGIAEIFVVRMLEMRDFILPLLLASISQTAGLMLLGVAAWRYGLLREPERHRRALALILAVCLISIPTDLAGMGRTIGLAFAYASALLLWSTPARLRWLSPFGAVGQMALTNYLMQSLILSLIFYGFGLGLFGKLLPPAGIGIAFAIFVFQALISRAWLNRFRFGPAEWLWRSLTYGTSQPIRREIVPRSEG